MAYGNVFPTTYQPYYPMQSNNYQAQYPQQQSPQSNGLIWVQGEAGAKSYLVAPNNTVQLWDSESQTIYLKSADASGMPSMRILDYTIRNQQPTQIPITQSSNDFATKQEIAALRAEIDALKMMIPKEALNESVIQRNAESATVRHHAEVPTVQTELQRQPAGTGATAS